MDKILQFNPYRFTLFPIHHLDIWRACKEQQAVIWTAEELDLAQDVADWERLDEDKKHFLSYVLAFFAGCFTADTEILDVSLNKIKIGDIPEKLVKGEVIYTYSCSPSGAIEVSKITNAWETKKVDKLLKITLDNEEEITCTPEHRFMMRDGSYKFAFELTRHDSLMPLYSRRVKRASKLRNQIKQNTINGSWSNAYHVAAERSEVPNIYDKGVKDVHHLDLNSLNDSPENLLILSRGQHCALHSKDRWVDEEKRKEFTENSRKTMKNNWTNNPEFIEKAKENARKLITAYNKSEKHKLTTSEVTKSLWQDPEFREKISKSSSKTIKKTLVKLWGDPNLREKMTKERAKSRVVSNFLKRLDKGMPLEEAILNARSLENHFPSVSEFLSFVEKTKKITISQDLTQYNHKVLNVEEIILTDKVPVYDIEVDSEHHNFPLAAGVFVHNSDNIVNENLAQKFCVEVQYPEARYFYTTQQYMESVHAETYSLLIDTYLKSEEEKLYFFHAMDNIPVVKMKADWALKWINDTDSFAERLVAFACVEGIFFCSSFCAIYYLCGNGLLPGLAFSNELISRDESQHMQFACLLYQNHIENKLSKNRVYEIIQEAVEVERYFVQEALPVTMIGMSSDLMFQYVKFVADGLLLDLGYSKIYNVENPFPFMERISLQKKTNFFERRVGQYALANVGSSREDKIKLLDEDI